MVTTPVELLLLAVLCHAASGIPGCLLRRQGAAGEATAIALGLVGSAAGLAGLALHAIRVETPVLSFGSLALGRVEFALDGLSALFAIPILLVSALGSLYGAGYWSESERRDGARRLRFWWGIMTASMLAVVLARDAILFLIAWEAMALSAFFLICTEEEQPEVRRASWIYLAATHAGTLCLVGCFALLANAQQSFALWPVLAGDARGWLPATIFALGVLGFGLKAGLMPLHVWLPGAHANAPSHVSALLSGVLLKMGVYGLVRVCGLLPEPPLWWGGSLLGIGALSGVLGIAFALAQQDLKRMLAYSSIENVGIVAIGVGLAAVGRSLGREDLVVLGLSGALLHALNHSLFKPLLFLVAGSVLHATGTRRVSALGGLAQRMPHTFALAVVGAVAICGLPPLNGFAGELLIYLGLFRSAWLGAGASWAWASLAAPALAMIGALAVAGFVKVLGVAFCGAPRTPEALHAHDPVSSMLAPMRALAGFCLALGLWPAAAAPLLSRAVAAWDPQLGPVAPALAALAPLAWVSALGAALLAGAGLVASRLGRRRAPAATVTWDCGYADPTARMQYVDASFAETLMGLFDWALRSQRPFPRLRDPFPAPARFQTDVPDVVLDRAVLPALRSADRALAPVRALQRGPVQMYLLYVLMAVVLLVLVAR
jgi:hydrogenase-4 component B